MSDDFQWALQRVQDMATTARTNAGRCGANRL